MSGKKPITNKGHPVTDAYENQWHKLAGLIMTKLNCRSITIGPEDIANIEGLNIVLRDGVNGDGLLHLDLVDDATALEYLELSKQ